MTDKSYLPCYQKTHSFRRLKRRWYPAQKWMKTDEKVWVIMSKDRKVIAKGRTKERYLIHLSDHTNRMRIMTYVSKAMAENAFKSNFFYYKDEHGNRFVRCPYTADDLEAVEARMILEIPGV